MIKIIINGNGTVAAEIDSTNVKDAETMKKHIEEAAMLREHAQLAAIKTTLQAEAKMPEDDAGGIATWKYKKLL